MSLSEYFTALANKMRSKTGKAATMTPSEMVTEVDAVYQAGVNSIQTQTKTVTAGTAATTVNPDSGKLLSSVTVNPTPSQAKTAAAQPKASAQTISPDSGKLLSGVTIPAAFGGNVVSYFNTSTEKVGITGTGTTGKLILTDLTIGAWYLIILANPDTSMSIGVTYSKTAGIEEYYSSGLSTGFECKYKVNGAWSSGNLIYKHGIEVCLFKTNATTVSIGLAGFGNGKYAAGYKFPFFKIADP